jgi:hypothetical protein
VEKSLGVRVPSLAFEQGNQRSLFHSGSARLDVGC